LLAVVCPGLVLKGAQVADAGGSAAHCVVCPGVIGHGVVWCELIEV